MVYKFRLLSNEIKDFIRDIEILGNQTFFDFHKAIQDDLNYDSSQIASFFLTNALWEKEQEFILFDMSDVPNNTMIAMDRARLKDFIRDPRQRLLYIFDVFNERSLFIELVDNQEESRYADYPAVVFSKGSAPQQIRFGNRDLGIIPEEETASYNFSGGYAAEDTEELKGELDTDEDEKGEGDEFNDENFDEFGEEGFEKEGNE